MGKLFLGSDGEPRCSWCAATPATLPITIMNGGFPSTMTDAYLKKFAWRVSNLD